MSGSLFEGQETQPGQQRFGTLLPPDAEARFLAEMMQGPYGQWQDAFRGRFGEMPNLNDPQYDYRGAWRSGVSPQPYAPDQGFPHWPSVAPGGQSLKAPEHPTAWMEQFMRRFGFDPNQAPPAVIEQGRREGIVPGTWARQNLPDALPPPTDTELQIGGEAGARRYRDRARGRDLDVSPSKNWQDQPHWVMGPRPYWVGDPGIYGGARPVTPGLDEVIRQPAEPSFPAPGINLWPSGMPAPWWSGGWRP